METVIDSLLNEEARRKERGISMQYATKFVDNSGKRKKSRRNKGRDKPKEI